jgi:hypothetical protein
MLTMIYMTRIQNMSFFLLKVNNPSVRNPVWPPVWPPSGPRRVKKNKKYFYFFWLFLPAGKEGKKYFGFRFSIPKIPELRGLRRQSREKKKVFRPSSPSHQTKLYSSLEWLNSKVPKPFFPFTPKLIDVDGF